MSIYERPTRKERKLARTLFAVPSHAREQVSDRMVRLGWDIHKLAQEAGVSIFDALAYTINPNQYQHPRHYGRIMKALKR
jgi:hypothetical protein